MNTTNEGPPPPRPAKLDRPEIVGMRREPIRVRKEGGSK